MIYRNINEGQQANRYRDIKAKQAEEEKRKEEEYAKKQFKRAIAKKNASELINNISYSAEHDPGYRERNPNDYQVKSYKKKLDKHLDADDYAEKNMNKYLYKQGIDPDDISSPRDLSAKQRRDALDTYNSSFKHYMKTHKNESCGIFESVFFYNEI